MRRFLIPAHHHHLVQQRRRRQQQRRPIAPGWPTCPCLRVLPSGCRRPPRIPGRPSPTEPPEPPPDQEAVLHDPRRVNVPVERGDPQYVRGHEAPVHPPLNHEGWAPPRSVTTVTKGVVLAPALRDVPSVSRDARTFRGRDKQRGWTDTTMSALLPPSDLPMFAGSLDMHSLNGPKHISSNTKSYRNNPRGGGGGGGRGLLVDATVGGGCDKRGEAALVGGAMGKRKWCVVCPLTYFVRRS